MKKILFFVLSLIVSATTIAQTPQYMCAGAANGGNSFPFGTTNYKVQLLYKPGMFNSLPPTGFITKLYFRPYASITPPSTATYSNFIIQMGNTALGSLSSGPWNTGLTQVANFPTLTLNNLVGNQWFSITLQTPFYYDNTQNLILEMSQTTSGSTWYIATSTPTFSPTFVHRMYGPNGTASSAGVDGAGSPIYDMGFDIFAGYPCTSTPTSTVKAPLWVCPNDTFNVAPATFYANANYQWKYSKDGTTWSNVTTSLGMYGDFNDNITEPKWYRCKITCLANPNLTYTTPDWKVGIRPFYYCYCKNKSSSSTGLDIGNVTVTNSSNGLELMNNGNPLPALNNTTANKNYTSYMDTLANSQNVVPINLYRDSNYTFKVTQMNSGPSVVSGTVAVFLDWNRDGVYDQNTEEIMEQTITNANQSTDKTYKIPSNAEIGITGMRVIIQKGAPVLPCGNYGEGETEDYIVNLSYEPCKGPVNGGKVEGDTSVCWGYDYLVTDTTYEHRKSNFSRSWQVSGDNKLWFNIAGSNDKDTLMRTFIPAQPLFYRNRLICNTTNDTSYSQTLNVAIKAGFKCYCFSQAIGGRGSDSSDAGGFSLAGIVNNDGGTHLMNNKATHKRTDHTDEAPIEMDADSVYQMTVFHTMTSTTHADAKVTVFMDFNNNNVYDLPEDLVYKGYTSVSNFTLVDHVSVKPIAIYDVPTGMRVILNNDIAPNKPSDEACGVYTSGETEDYMIIFRKKGTTNVNAIKGIDNLGIYPNPTSGKFTLSFNAAANIKEITLSVTNLTGQQIWSGQYEVGSGKTFTKDLSLEGQAKGVYFMELRSEGQKMVRKVVVE